MKLSLFLALFTKSVQNLSPGTRAIVIVKDPSEEVQGIQIRGHGLEITKAMHDRICETLHEILGEDVNTGGQVQPIEEMEEDSEEDHDDAEFEDDLEKRIEKEEDPGEDPPPVGETQQDEEEDESEDAGSDILGSPPSASRYQLIPIWSRIASLGGSGQGGTEVIWPPMPHVRCLIPLCSEDEATLAKKLAALNISQDTSPQVDNTPKSQFRAESPVSVAVAKEGSSRDAETLAEQLGELDISQDTRAQVRITRKSRIKSPAVAKKDISQVTQPQEKLLTNATLQKYGLYFNTLYRIFVCSPDECGSGVAINQVSAHLGAKSFMKAHVKCGSKWVEKEVPHTSHKKLDKDSDALRDELVRALVEDPASGVAGLQDLVCTTGMTAQQWKASASARLAAGQSGPVAGLRIFDQAICCRHCRAGGVASRSLEQDKCGKPHERKKILHDRYVQTMLSDRDWRFFFDVPGDTPAPALAADTPPPAPVDVVDLLHRRKAALIGPDSQWTKTQELASTSVSPAFHDTGVPAFVRCFDPIKIRQRTNLRRLDGNLHGPLERLRRLNTLTAAEDVQLAKDAHPSVLTALTAGKRSSNPQRSAKPFSVPLNLQPYLRAEIALVSMILKELKKPTKPSISNSPWSSLLFLTATQTELAHLLNKELAKPFNEETACQVYRDFLRELYFPSTLLLPEALKTFSSPIAVFLALNCIDPDGGFTSLDNISPIVAKIQCLMALRALHCFEKQKSHGVTADKWFDTVLEFCAKFLTEDRLSPYSVVRHWMHVFTAAALKTPRPYLIQWKAERTLLLGKREVDVDAYFAFLRRKLDHLEQHIEKEVLFGISLDGLNILCDPSQLKMKMKPGEKGVLNSDARKGLDNPESDHFARALFAGRHLEPEGQGGGLQVDPKKGMTWLNHIHTAMYELHPLCHTTQGLPGRCSEEELFLHENIDVDTMHGTLGFRATHLKTGAFKHIFRMLDPRVSRLLYIMVRIVRPVELLVLLQHVIPPSKQEKTLNVYHNRIFATMGCGMTNLSTNLGSWLQGTTDIPGLQFHIGMRMYRQFATALDRQYLGALKENPLATVADHQAGRTTAVSDKHYAVERWKTDASAARAICVQKSLDWQRMIGISKKTADN
ncbi:hypothetical protein B0H16DRAFT_1694756 [Mycena metata]|uniref:Uncharacterized protein n=1 Tax=Mycena metata TaxID=1033252 RepID=A0AAD7IBZ0_9AGAR|nr:hypothetical protein B0H16DRAFT_1694756 [Mycena metata]